MLERNLKACFGFANVMGINHFPSIGDYWSRDQRLHCAPIAYKIPCLTFQKGFRYLFRNNKDLAVPGDPVHDWLWQGSTLDQHYIRYELSKQVAVDEAMISFRATLACNNTCQRSRSSKGSKCGYWETSTPARESRE